MTGWKFSRLLLPDCRGATVTGETADLAAGDFAQGVALISGADRSYILRGQEVGSYPWGGLNDGLMRLFRESMMEQCLTAIREFYPLSTFRQFTYTGEARSNGTDYYDADGCVDIVWRSVGGVKLTTSLLVHSLNLEGLYGTTNGYMLSYPWELFPVGSYMMQWSILGAGRENLYPPSPGLQAAGVPRFRTKPVWSVSMNTYAEGNATTRFIGWIGVHPTDGVVLLGRDKVSSLSTTNPGANIEHQPITILAPPRALDAFVDWGNLKLSAPDAPSAVYLSLYLTSYLSVWSPWAESVGGGGAPYSNLSAGDSAGTSGSTSRCGAIAYSARSLGGQVMISPSPYSALGGELGGPILIGNGDTTIVDPAYCGLTANPGATVSSSNPITGGPLGQSRWQVTDGDGRNWLLDRSSQIGYRQAEGGDLAADAATCAPYNSFPFT